MESKWKIRIEAPALRELRALLESEGNRAYYAILDDILALEDDPLPKGCIRLRKTKDFYRIYAHGAKCRIIDRVLTSSRKILIERVRPRPTAYSGLDRWGD
ncbi:MAG: hypothetical protein JO336_04860 [Acidobacteriia bacterium]|nr:hypothetical protein [Terriglobia bacterium]MBV8905498.1 hypothetical protein [Terriglobia bacterium]